MYISVKKSASPGLMQMKQFSHLICGFSGLIKISFFLFLKLSFRNYSENLEEEKNSADKNLQEKNDETQEYV